MSILKKIEYSLKYNRTGKLNRNGKALIQIRAYQNGKNRYFSTEVWIKPDYWDEKNKRVKSIHPNGYIFNKRIREKKEALEAFEAKMINLNGHFSIVRLHEFEQYNSELPTFTSFYEKELRLSPIQADSLKNQKTTFKKLCDFKRQVLFEDLNYRFVVGFDRFLRKQRLGINTINKHHRNLGKFIRLGIKSGYLDVNADPYIKFSPDTTEPQRVFLEQLELERIENLVIKDRDAHLRRIKDFFLIGCWTGLRFSDIKALRIEHLVETGQGLELQIRTKKTSKLAILPLHLLFRESEATYSKPEALFRRYLRERQDLPKAFGSFPLFGKISNQYFNRSLKDIARLAGIQKKLSSHAGRRTFATILATKVEMPVLQKLLQHSTLDMVQVYVQLSNKQITEELKKVDW